MPQPSSDSISIVNNRMETTVYSKPTDAHLYLNANSSHPKSQILGIAKGVALRLRQVKSIYFATHNVNTNNINKIVI
jgi:hypothetical protein